jgi:transposase InsO family protein
VNFAGLKETEHWILDSGASCHFTGDKSRLKNIRVLDTPLRVQLADGKEKSVTECGDIHIVGNGTRLVLKEVHHLPGLEGSLYSLGYALKNGGTLKSDKDYIGVVDNNGLTLDFVPRSPGDTIYVLDFDRTTAGLLAKTTVSQEIMHRRLAHPSSEVLKRAATNTEGFPDGVEFDSADVVCRGCALGKMHSRPFPTNERRATERFGLIHSDLKQFSVDSYRKYKYVITFLDDFSSYAWVVGLRSKDAALPATRHFLSMVKTQFNATVKSWMSDAGGEYKSAAYDKMLKENGIEILTSAPHQPQQNGRAERLNRTLMEKSESMRHLANLPPSWWDFAFYHACHVYNRTPVERLKWRTPYEALNGDKPRIDHLRVFGCGAYVWLPPAVRSNKLAPKSELMVYLGVPEGGHGHLFMRTATNTVFNGTTAVFEEANFPKSSVSYKRSDAQTESTVSKDKSPNGDKQIPRREMDDDDYVSPTSFTPPKGKGVQPLAPPAPPMPQPGPVGPPPPPAPPRRSVRTRNVVSRPDNTYGGARPSEVASNINDDRTWESTTGVEPVPPGVKDPSKAPKRTRAARGKEAERVPGPSSQPAPQRDNSPVARESEPSQADDDPAEEDDAEVQHLAELCRAGGGPLLNYLLLKAVAPVESAPNRSKIREWNFRDIARLPKAEQEEWISACQDELKALNGRGVFQLVDPPQGRKVIRNRWVFDVKTDGRKKARLVARGDSQIEGLDFSEVYSPVVRFETFRLMLALSALENWHMSGVDVRNAYLYGELLEEIYMHQPEGFKSPGKEGKVIRLRRALYGLKQGGLAWWRSLDKSMSEMGFKRCVSDAGIFVAHDTASGTVCYAIIYVDDAIFCGPDKAIVEKYKAAFMKKWECRDLGEPKEFLRMRISRHGRNLVLDQRDYLQKVLERCGMADAKRTPTPLPQGYYPKPAEKPADAGLRSRYQTIIGSLLYLMLGTRPDIAFAVTKLAQFAANPSDDHLDKALYICRYLVGTKEYDLTYKGAPGEGLIAYADSDWGTDPYNARRSQSGYFVSLAGAPITWTSRAQKTVATSSTEAEYMSISDCCRQVVWYRSLLEELGYTLETTPVTGDNQGSLFIASNPVTEARSKHIDIRYHKIREFVQEKKVALFFLEGVENPADLLTKNLGHIKFCKFRAEMGLTFY